MEDPEYRKNLQLYIEKTDFNVQTQGEIFKTMNIQSYSKCESTAKMLLRFKIKPEWLDHKQSLNPLIITMLFDASSAAFHFLIDPRHATSIKISTSYLQQASTSDELILDLSLQKLPNNFLNIQMRAFSNNILIAKAEHTKKFLNNTAWLPKL